MPYLSWADGPPYSNFWSILCNMIRSWSKGFILCSGISGLHGSSVSAQDLTGDLEAKVDRMLSLLTLEEKAALCHGYALFSSPGVERLGIPELQMLDGPHGIRPELKRHSWDHAGWTTDSATAFPALTCLAATFDPDLAYLYGQALGEEARFRNKDVLLAPGVNIYRTPLNGRNFEYLGEDPLLAGKMAASYIQGVQSNGVAACVKHFALNNQETGRHTIDVRVSDRALHEIYLPAFRTAVIEGGVWSVMGAYNQFQGQHCCHNELLLQKILKQDWKFDGVVISDWGGTHDSREAIFNGLDIEMGSNAAYSDYFLADPFLHMLREGKVDESILDDKARRIIRLMLRTTLDTNRSPGSMTTPEHIAVATRVASSGIVLLKNEEAFFPLDPGRDLTIAVIGENAVKAMASGGGSSELKAKYEISPLEGLRNTFRHARINYAPGYASYNDSEATSRTRKKQQRKLLKEAAALAASADVVLFIGGLNKEPFQDHEDHDRKTLNLPYGQDELIAQLVKANDQTAVILVGGNAVAMPWVQDVKAILQAWYGGSEAGNALADVISGTVNPSGKLPFSFPVKLEDNAAHHFGLESYPGIDGTQNYLEDILVGYRWHDTKQISPLFAFGYGLSYTSFQLSAMRTDRSVYGEQDTITCSVRVENTGSADGAEVIQVYVGKPASSVARALKDLKGFQKIFVPQGSSAVVEIRFPVEQLQFYDEDLPGWNLEKGIYKLYVGTASNKITEELEITVE